MLILLSANGFAAPVDDVLWSDYYNIAKQIASDGNAKRVESIEYLADFLKRANEQ